VPGIECKVGCILHYVARDFPTAYWNRAYAVPVEQRHVDLGGS